MYVSNTAICNSVSWFGLENFRRIFSPQVASPLTRVFWHVHFTHKLIPPVYWLLGFVFQDFPFFPLNSRWCVTVVIQYRFQKVVYYLTHGTHRAQNFLAFLFSPGSYINPIRTISPISRDFTQANNVKLWDFFESGVWIGFFGAFRAISRR